MLAILSVWVSLKSCLTVIFRVLFSGSLLLFESFKVIQVYTLGVLAIPTGHSSQTDTDGRTVIDLPTHWRMHCYQSHFLISLLELTVIVFLLFTKY